jgi:8-oxo-dGTP diphosphatase
MAEEQQRYSVIPRTLVFVFKDNKLLMMKYSGKGSHQTQEKTDRKDIYNPIGGHIEEGESPIDSAIKEAREEAGIALLDAKVKGIVNVSGFAGKNIMNFIISGTTRDNNLGSTLEGELEWVDIGQVTSLPVFPDMKSIFEKLMLLKDGEIFCGAAKFDGKFGLEMINLVTT